MYDNVNVLLFFIILPTAAQRNQIFQTCQNILSLALFSRIKKKKKEL